MKQRYKKVSKARKVGKQVAVSGSFFRTLLTYRPSDLNTYLLSSLQA